MGRTALVGVFVREAHTVVDRLSDAPPGGAPLVAVERKVDAPVQPEDSRLGRRLVKRAERARLLRRHQVVIGVEGVGERLVSEEVGEDGCGRPGLGRVPKRYEGLGGVTMYGSQLSSMWSWM